ncbi:thiamine phosphate synthase [Mameliella sediminis]|uniref:thiamine phosphate synthase n=1 Tax=Mameliella sediminis TaxID=2836866 RepID=UPI001C480925|nr:thiamine phosphate synthase [Mameliella sediminis]MBV7396453.1 thiamine phosphate synthase [Mameliella sediminis]MBY6116798.1 thiamine phosphate synthase [Antarctobacter heliothermus]MBY6146551.1 thiamine phosphate synthase [Mameliella alba]MCA0956307.1 thiamine phosphate synthase [Mameliella alba]
MIPCLCFITDAGADAPVAEQAIAAARGGAGWIQLRDKTMPDAEFAGLARQLMPVLRAEGAELVINDRVEVAIALNAPALHIGQGDGNPAEIRKRLPPGCILGLSVENESQLAQVPEGVDYLGVGPLRATSSKPDHAPPIGLDGFARIAGQSRLPCLAIGGLAARDAWAVKAAGGAGLAVVSAISRSADMTAATRDILKAWSDA